MPPRKTITHPKTDPDHLPTHHVTRHAVIVGMCTTLVLVSAAFALYWLSSSKQSSPPKQAATSDYPWRFPIMPGKGFFTVFGKVIDVKDSVVTIATVSPVNAPGSEIFYRVSIDSTTVVTHQISDISSKDLKFTTAKGTLSEIHTGTFLSATTDDNISDGSILHTVTADYFDKQPFLSINNK